MDYRASFKEVNVDGYIVECTSYYTKKDCSQGKIECKFGKAKGTYSFNSPLIQLPKDNIIISREDYDAQSQEIDLIDLRDIAAKKFFEEQVENQKGMYI